MKNINEFLAIINLCNDTELETLTSRCEELLKERKTAARNALRHELTENLSKAIGDILHHGFHLIIENIDDPEWVANFNPNEGYHIKLK